MNLDGPSFHLFIVSSFHLPSSLSSLVFNCFLDFNLQTVIAFVMIRLGKFVKQKTFLSKIFVLLGTWARSQRMIRQSANTAIWE